MLSEEPRELRDVFKEASINYTSRFRKRMKRKRKIVRPSRRKLTMIEYLIGAEGREKGVKMDAPAKRGLSQGPDLHTRRRQQAAELLGDDYKGCMKADDDEDDLDAVIRPSGISVLGRSGGVSNPHILQQVAKTKVENLQRPMSVVIKANKKASVRHRQTVILRDVIEKTPGGGNIEVDVGVQTSQAHGRGLRRHDKNVMGVDAAALAKGLERRMDRKGRKSSSESTVRLQLRAKRVLNNPTTLPNEIRPDKVYTSLYLGNFGMKKKYTSLDYRIAIEHLQTDRWMDRRLIHPQLKNDILAEARAHDDDGGCDMNTMFERFEVYFIGKDRVETMPALGAIENALKSMHKHTLLHPSLSEYTEKVAQHPSAVWSAKDFGKRFPLRDSWSYVGASYKPKAPM